MGDLSGAGEYCKRSLVGLVEDSAMRITPHLLEAFLKCETKCWLRAAGEQGAGNAYADWLQTQSESYRDAQLERLRAETPPDDCAISPSIKEVKAGKWQVAVEVEVQSNYVLPRVHNEDVAPSSAIRRDFADTKTACLPLLKEIIFHGTTIWQSEHCVIWPFSGRFLDHSGKKKSIAT